MPYCYALIFNLIKLYTIINPNKRYVIENGTLAVEDCRLGEQAVAVAILKVSFISIEKPPTPLQLQHLHPAFGESGG